MNLNDELKVIRNKKFLVISTNLATIAIHNEQVPQFLSMIQKQYKKEVVSKKYLYRLVKTIKENKHILVNKKRHMVEVLNKIISEKSNVINHYKHVGFHNGKKK